MQALPLGFPLAWPMGWRRIAPEHRRPGKFNTKEWKQSPFNPGAQYRSTKDLTVAIATDRIISELDALGVMMGDMVISTNVALRLDGFPRSGQGEPLDPGAAVYWTIRGRPRVMAIDRYTRVADNLAAIAATLNALRAIDRHGGAEIQERAYTGFARIAPPEAFDPWAVLGIMPGSPASHIRLAFRRKAAKAHPDAGGSVAEFQELERARREALATI